MALSQSTLDISILSSCRAPSPPLSQTGGGPPLKRPRFSSVVGSGRKALFQTPARPAQPSTAPSRESMSLKRPRASIAGTPRAADASVTFAVPTSITASALKNRSNTIYGATNGNGKTSRSMASGFVFTAPTPRKPLTTSSSEISGAENGLDAILTARKAELELLREQKASLQKDYSGLLNAIEKLTESPESRAREFEHMDRPSAERASLLKQIASLKVTVREQERALRIRDRTNDLKDVALTKAERYCSEVSNREAHVQTQLQDAEARASQAESNATDLTTRLDQSVKLGLSQLEEQDLEWRKSYLMLHASTIGYMRQYIATVNQKCQVKHKEASLEAQIRTQAAQDQHHQRQQLECVEESQVRGTVLAQESDARMALCAEFFHALEQQLGKLAQEKQELGMALVPLSMELEELKATHSETIQERDVATADLCAAKTELAQALAQLIQSEQEKAQLVNQVQGLRLNMDNAVLDQEQLLADMADVSGELAVVQAQLASSAEQWASERKVLTDELAELRKSAEQTQLERDQLAQATSLGQQQSVQNEEIIRQLQQDLVSKTSALTDAESRNQDLQSKTLASAERCESLSLQIAELEKSLNTAREQIQATTHNASEQLAHDVNQVSSLLAQVHDCVYQKWEALLSPGTQLPIMADEVGEMAGASPSVREIRHAPLRKQIGGFVTWLTQFHETITSAHSNMQLQHQAQLESAQATLRSTERELNQTKTQFKQDLANAKNDAQTRIHRLLSENQALSTEVKSLKTRINELDHPKSPARAATTLGVKSPLRTVPAITVTSSSTSSCSSVSGTPTKSPLPSSNLTILAGFAMLAAPSPQPNSLNSSASPAAAPAQEPARPSPFRLSPNPHQSQLHSPLRTPSSPLVSKSLLATFNAAPAAVVSADNVGAPMMMEVDERERDGVETPREATDESEGVRLSGEFQTQAPAPAVETSTTSSMTTFPSSATSRPMPSPAKYPLNEPWRHGPSILMRGAHIEEAELNTTEGPLRQPKRLE